MATGLNEVFLLGYLGKDPGIRHLDNGKSIVTVSLATTETYKNKSGERVSNTEWHNVVFWTPLAEIVDNYLKKGSKIFVKGKLSTRSYEKDGIVKYVTEVIAREMVMLDNKGQSEGSLGQDHKGEKRTEENKSKNIYQPSMGSDNDLPF